MLKERLNTYRQHIRQPELQQIDVEGHIRTYGGGNFKIMLFFATRADKKIFKKSYEAHLIEKFKSTLNKRHKKIIANVTSTPFTDETSLMRFNICT